MSEIHTDAANVLVHSGAREVEASGELHVKSDGETVTFSLLPTGYLNDDAEVTISVAAFEAIVAHVAAANGVAA